MIISFCKLHSLGYNFILWLYNSANYSLGYDFILWLYNSANYTLWDMTLYCDYIILQTTLWDMTLYCDYIILQTTLWDMTLYCDYIILQTTLWDMTLYCDYIILQTTPWDMTMWNCAISHKSHGFDHLWGRNNIRVIGYLNGPWLLTQLTFLYIHWLMKTQSGRHHDVETFSTPLAFCEMNTPISQGASRAEH